MVTQTDEATDDVTVTDHASVVMVTPHTQKARDWVDEHIELESWSWMGNSFACEPRHVDRLVAGMREDGLTVKT